MTDKVDCAIWVWDNELQRKKRIRLQHGVLNDLQFIIIHGNILYRWWFLFVVIYRNLINRY